MCKSESSSIIVTENSRRNNEKTKPRRQKVLGNSLLIWLSKEPKIEMSNTNLVKILPILCILFQQSSHEKAVEIPFNFSSSFKGLLLCEAAQHKTKNKVYMSWCQGANLSPIYFLSLPLLENIHRSTRNLVCNCSRAKLNLNSKEVAVYGTYRLSSSAEMLPISAYLCTFRDSLKISGYILHDIRWNL